MGKRDRAVPYGCNGGKVLINKSLGMVKQIIDREKMLIKYVVDNDIVNARKQCILILESDTTAKEKRFCEHMLSKLRTQSTFFELPKNISLFATIEDSSASFNEERYFLSGREKTLYEEIFAADKVSHKLSEKRVRYLNSTLLYGESGTGKTTFGRFVAYKLGIPFVCLHFANLISSLLGETGKNIQRVFEYAKNQRCVLMLDEIDAIGGSRGGQQEVGEMARVTIALMQALDTLSNDTIVIAATNRIDIIDDALKRRFTRTQKIEKLTPKERHNFAMTYLKDLKVIWLDDEVAGLISGLTKQSEIEKAIIKKLVSVLKCEVEKEMGGGKIL